MKLYFTKSRFLMKKTLYLGHVITNEGIEPYTTKTKILKNYAVPVSAKQVRSFLGFTNYFRAYVINYAKIVKPL